MRIGLKFPEYVEYLDGLFSGGDLRAIAGHRKKIEEFTANAVKAGQEERVEAGTAIIVYLDEAEYNWDKSPEIEQEFEEEVEVEYFEYVDE